MSRYIEDVARDQASLLPERLEDWVDEDHPACVIDLFVEDLDLPTLGFERTAAARTVTDALD